MQRKYKYGLSTVYVDAYRGDDREYYIDLVNRCHSAVEDYWDKYGYEPDSYYKTLKLADPDLDKEVSEWRTNSRRKRAAMEGEASDAHE